MPKIAKVPVVAGVVLVQDGKVLLVQEAKPAVKGLWNLPGGRVDEGETLEQAAMREAKEEVGFDVTIDREVILLHRSMGESVLHAFAANIIGGQLKFPSDEILDARWFSPTEVRALGPALRSQGYVVGALEATGL